MQRHIGVFAPSGTFLCGSGRIDHEKIDRSLMHLRQEACVTRFSIRCQRTRFAGSDRIRQRAFQRALASPVDALLALRGGFGAQMLLATLKNTPQVRFPILCGYSDVTVLLNASWVWFDRVALHSPMLADWQRETMTRYCQRFFLTLEAMCQNGSWVHHDAVTQVYKAGEKVHEKIDFATMGRLWGGNLTMLTTLLGTRASPVPRLQNEDNILLIEEVGESAYRIERMLRHLGQAHAFTRTKIVYLGDVTQADRYARQQGGYTLDIALQRLSKRYPDIVWVTGLAMGHANQRCTYPIGLHCRCTLVGQQAVFQGLKRSIC